MEVNSKVLALISGLQADLNKIGIGKNGRNETQKFRFRAIDDMYGVIAPLLVKHKLVLVPSVESTQRETRETRSGSLQTFTVATVNYTFYCLEDGSSITLRYSGEAADSGDKSMSKALTMAFKYFLIHSLCIPLEGIDDGDSSTVEESIKSAPPFFLDAHLSLLAGASNQDKLNALYRAAVEQAKAAGADQSAMQALIDAGKKRKGELLKEAA